MKKTYTLLSLALGLLTACESYTDPTLSAPTVVTGAAENIYRMGATLSGSYTDVSSQAPAKECGILLSEMQSMPEPKVLQGSTAVSGAIFRIELRDLKPGKTYYYQSYANSGESIIKGEVSSFTTTYSNPPVFDTPEVVKFAPTTCTLSTPLIDDGDCEMLMAGYFWKEDEGDGVEPTFVDPSVNAVYEGGGYRAAFMNLRPGHTYLFRPYGINKEGVGLGKTISIEMEHGGVPALSYPEVSAQTRHSAQFASRVYDTGTSAYKKVGFCWSTTNRYPNIKKDEYQLIELPAEEGGTFSFQFEAKEQLTTYYICAFAENDEGVGYSEPFEFTTERFIELSNYTTNGEKVTVYGQVYHQSGHFQLIYAESEAALDNPSSPDVIKSNTQPAMDADGRFSETRSDLKPSTTYYVRALMGDENPMQSNTLRIQTGEKEGEEGEAEATVTPATEDEAAQASPSIQQLISQACQTLVPGANVQGITHTDGTLTYILDVTLKEMGDGQSLTVKAPKFIGFASTITPDYTSTDSETTGQQWLAKAESKLGLEYGMKNEGQDVTLEGKTGNRLTGYRITMEFTVKTMDYDNIKGQLIYSNFTKVDNVTYEEVQPDPTPDPTPDPEAVVTPATENEANQAAASIQQLINQACQAFGANAQGVVNADGSLTYTLDVTLQNMGNGQSLTVKAPKFIGFASTIAPDYTTTNSETTGQQWLAKAESKLGLEYGMKNEGQDVTLEGKTGNRLTGYRITMEFTVKTMEYDNIKGQLIYSNFTKVENVTYEEVEPDPTPDPEPENPDNTGSDGSIDDAPVEDL